MTEKDDKLPRDVSPPAGQGKDRRRSGRSGEAPKIEPGAAGAIEHDDLGNAVWNWRVDVPRRREDDPTIDLIECLDVDGLSVDDGDGDEPDAEEHSFNPYDKRR